MAQESIVVQSPSRVRLFCDPLDYSPPGSSVYGISQARILEWVAISFSSEEEDTLTNGEFLIKVSVPYQRVTFTQFSDILLCLIFIGWISHKVLGRSTGSYIQYPG